MGQAGIDYRFSGALRMRMLLGLEAREFQSAAYRSRVAPIGQASLIWTPTGLTTVTATLARSIEDAVEASAGGYTYTRADLDVTHELYRDVRLDAHVGIQDSEPLQANVASQTSVYGGVAATWQINRNISLTMSYQYTSQSGGTQTNQPAVNGVSSLGAYNANVIECAAPRGALGSSSLPIEFVSMPFAILQVVREFSLAGGSETVAFELQKAWEKAGVNSRVLANVVADGVTSPDLQRIAPWLARIGTRGRLRYLGRLIAVPLFTLLATRAIREQSDTIVLSHGDTLRGDVLVVHAVNRASLAVKRAAGSYRWMLNPMHLWVGWRDRLMIGGLRFSRYVAVSNRIAGELSLYYGVPAARITVIPNGINLERFAAEPNAHAMVRAEFAIPDAAPLLLFVGHEFGRKGLAPVILALSSLRSDVRLLVVGADDPTPYRKLAQAHDVSDRVHFTGPRGDLSTIYQAGDAFVLPTAYESFSLVCMEAMACGLPVFATSVGGIEDYLVDGVNGYTITHDPADIAAKLGALLDDPARLEALRNGARATAQNFDWNRIARLYANLLEEIYEERQEHIGP